MRLRPVGRVGTCFEAVRLCGDWSPERFLKHRCPRARLGTTTGRCTAGWPTPPGWSAPSSSFFTRCHGRCRAAQGRVACACSIASPRTDLSSGPLPPAGGAPSPLLALFWRIWRVAAACRSTLSIPTTFIHTLYLIPTLTDTRPPRSSFSWRRVVRIALCWWHGPSLPGIQRARTTPRESAWLHGPYDYPSVTLVPP